MKEWKDNFEGRGEVRGFTFQKCNQTERGYLYRVFGLNGSVWYEVFKRKENVRFNTISYPTSKAFGSWAWTYKDLLDANRKLISL